MEDLKQLNTEQLRDPKFIEACAQEIFKSADIDNSGYIDREELVKFINYYSLETGMKMPSKRQIDKIIDSFDTNGDGVIQLDEFTQFIKAVFEIIAMNNN